MTDSIKLSFLGAAGTVTGSRTLVESKQGAVLIDCGMFQGAKANRLRNWQPSPPAALGVDAVILTHGHLDHCGLLPRFVAEGYGGPIFASAPTCDVAAIILRDSARIQEEDAERANRLGFSKHQPARALYTQSQADAAIRQLQPVAPEQWHRAAPDIRFRLRDSGHILGSTIVELETPQKRIAFTGDLGRPQPMLLRPPKHPEECAILVLESTYGDRTHPPTDPKKQLARIVERTLGRGGNLIIPSFAVERAQELLYLFARLRQERAIGNVEIFLDSPMGANVTALLAKHSAWHRLTERELHDLTAHLSIIRDAAESQKNLERSEPAIIIAGSGMLTGGRVLRYLEQHGGNPATTILLVGYQTPGTRGRALLDGATELKFYGAHHSIRAEVEMLENLSAHADQSEILQWLEGLPHQPRLVYLNHGEPAASRVLAECIQQRFGWTCKVAAGPTVSE